MRGGIGPRAQQPCGLVGLPPNWFTPQGLGGRNEVSADQPSLGMTESRCATTPPNALQDEVSLPSDVLFDQLSSGTVETLTGSLKALEEHDLAALLERLDPRQTAATRCGHIDKVSGSVSGITSCRTNRARPPNQ